MAEKLETLHERLIQLEAREQVIVARAEAAAQVASSHSRDREFGDLRERILKIEMYLASNSPTQQVPILLTKGSSKEDPKAKDES